MCGIPNKLIFTIVSIIMVVPIYGNNRIVSQADSAYNADDFQLALELYTQAEDSHCTPELLYNKGNCYYRMGDLGHAVLYYERALKIDPTFEDAKANLQFVNSKIIDEKQAGTGTFISNTVHDIAMTATANTWATISLVFFVITAIAISVYIFSRKITYRKVGFFGGILTFISFIILILFAWYSYNAAHSHEDAIVVSPSSILSTKPRAPQSRVEEAMLLHQGTKIHIIDSVNTYDANGNRWYDVRIDNNHRAWIKDEDIERI